MDICLAVGAALLLRLPSPVTLSWQHSVERFVLQEEWHAEAAGLVLREARTAGLGAGVEVPGDARFADGLWRFTPALPPQRRVQLANSQFVRGYALCWSGQCTALAKLVGVDRPVTLSACE